MQTAWFHNDSLYRVEMTLLSNEALPYLMSALKQKFGKPVSKRTTRVQNGFGSQFEEKRLTWTNKVSTLELTYSTVPGRRPGLAFTLEAPRDDAQSKRAQTTRACRHVTEEHQPVENLPLTAPVTYAARLQSIHIRLAPLNHRSELVCLRIVRVRVIIETPPRLPPVPARHHKPLQQRR